MGQRLNELRDHELLLRCTNCGDSDNERKGHLYVNLSKGVYYCVRCNHGGNLSLGQQLNLSAEHDYLGSLGSLPPEDSDIEWPEDAMTTWPPMPAIRPSHLSPRMSYKDDKWHEWYSMYDRHGDLVGHHVRQTGAKHFYTVGSTGLCWAGAGDRPLLSTADDPLYVVEGPYDTIISPRAVSVFGLISPRRIRQFGYGHSVILVPDGDVWRNRQLMESLVLTLRSSLQMPNILGVIQLSGDPDELTTPIELMESIEATKIVNAFNRIKV